jgi:hypothetical protein
LRQYWQTFLILAKLPDLAPLALLLVQLRPDGFQTLDDVEASAGKRDK